jgi:hypothetical protein
MELWKDIENYEGKYQISTKGRIRNIKKGNFLTPSPDTKGYTRVNLWGCGGYKTKKVHRLVSLAFIDNPENKEQVNHKNGVKSDNRLENLEWNTSNENIQHGYDNDLISSKGIKNGRSVVNPTIVREIRILLEKKMKQKDIAAIYNVNPTIVCDINRKRTWTHIK